MLHLCRNLYSGRIDSSNCCLWLCEFIIFFLSVLIIPQETVFLEISLYKFTLLFPSSAAVLEVSSHSEPAPPVGPSASPSLSAHRPPFHICLLLRTPLDQFQFELHSLRTPPTSHSNPLSPNIPHPPRHILHSPQERKTVQKLSFWKGETFLLLDLISTCPHLKNSAGGVTSWYSNTDP